MIRIRTLNKHSDTQKKLYVCHYILYQFDHLTILKLLVQFILLVAYYCGVWGQRRDGFDSIFCMPRGWRALDSFEWKFLFFFLFSFQEKFKKRLQEKINQLCVFLQLFVSCILGLHMVYSLVYAIVCKEPYQAGMSWALIFFQFSDVASMVSVPRGL